MSSVSQRSDTRKMKELKVLELNQQGLSYRKIAKHVHLSLRDVCKYVHRISNKTRSPTTTSIHDEVILEYRVNNLRHEDRDLESQKQNLNNETRNLRAQISNLEDELRARRSEIERIVKERVNAILHDKELMFFISFFALTEALRNHPDIKLILFDLVMSEGVLLSKSVMNNQKNDQFAVSYYNKLVPLYDEYFSKVMEIIYRELMRSCQLMRAPKNNQI